MESFRKKRKKGNRVTQAKRRGGGGGEKKRERERRNKEKALALSGSEPPLILSRPQYLKRAHCPSTTTPFAWVQMLRR